MMAKTLSEDLRVRVIAAVEDGLSRHAAAARFGIGVASAVRWLRAWHDEGAIAGKPRGGDRHSARIEACGAVILEAIEAQVEITLVEVDPFQWTVFGLAGYVAARATSRSASYAMGDR